MACTAYYTCDNSNVTFEQALRGFLLEVSPGLALLEVVSEDSTGCDPVACENVKRLSEYLRLSLNETGVHVYKIDSPDPLTCDDATLSFQALVAASIHVQDGCYGFNVYEVSGTEEGYSCDIFISPMDLIRRTMVKIDGGCIAYRVIASEGTDPFITCDQNIQMSAFEILGRLITKLDNGTYAWRVKGIGSSEPVCDAEICARTIAFTDSCVSFGAGLYLSINTNEIVEMDAGCNEVGRTTCDTGYVSTATDFNSMQIYNWDGADWQLYGDYNVNNIDSSGGQITFFGVIQPGWNIMFQKALLPDFSDAESSAWLTEGQFATTGAQFMGDPFGYSFRAIIRNPSGLCTYIGIPFNNNV